MLCKKQLLVLVFVWFFYFVSSYLYRVWLFAFDAITATLLESRRCFLSSGSELRLCSGGYDGQDGVCATLHIINHVPPSERRGGAKQRGEGAGGGRGGGGLESHK